MFVSSMSSKPSEAFYGRWWGIRADENWIRHLGAASQSRASGDKTVAKVKNQGATLEKLLTSRPRQVRGQEWEAKRDEE